VSDLKNSNTDSAQLQRGARTLRQAVLRGDLLPGQQLEHQELVAQHGMSSMSTRDVLRILEADGLNERIPYQGVHVSEVSPKKAKVINPIRALLKGFAVQLGVPRLTEPEIESWERLNHGTEDALASHRPTALRLEPGRYSQPSSEGTAVPG